MSEDERPTPEQDGVPAVVLDVLPHGRTEDDRPQYQKNPLVYALGTEHFQLFEGIVSDSGDVSIGDQIDVGNATFVERTNRIEYGDLPSGAQSELEYVIEDLVAADASRFVDFYNDAQPITLRLHQLDLLPGIGEKLRNSILDERDRRPFQSFADLEERVSGLHNAEDVIVERLLEELRETELKYRIFARSDSA